MAFGEVNFHAHQRVPDSAFRQTGHVTASVDSLLTISYLYEGEDVGSGRFVNFIRGPLPERALIDGSYRGDASFWRAENIDSRIAWINENAPDAKWTFDYDIKQERLCFAFEDHAIATAFKLTVG